MKKRRDGFLRALRPISLVCVIALGFMTIVATGGGGGGGGGDGGGGVTETGTITGYVRGTTVIAVNDKGDIVASVSTAGRDPDVDLDGDGESESFSFSLTGVPVGTGIRVYLLVHGVIFPMYFDSNGDGVPDTNVFSLTSSTTLNLGFIDTESDEHEGKAIPQDNPTHNSAVRAQSENTDIPKSLNEPNTAGLSLSQLLANGFDALNDAWGLRARTYFKAAVDLAGSTQSNDADTARFFYALTRVGAVMFETCSDGNPGDMDKVGDLLDKFGCDSCDTKRANFDAISFPEPLPSTSPTGEDVQNFLYDVVVAELEGAISNLGEIFPTFNKQWTLPLTNEVVESDYGDVIFFTSMFEAAIAPMQIQKAYDLDADIDETVNDNIMTIEKFLINNGDFLTLSSSSSSLLNDARNNLDNALDDLVNAIDWMQTEGDPQDDDFINLADMTPTEIEEARAGIATAKVCLYGECTVDDNETPGDTDDDTIINLDPFLSGVINLGAKLPPFVGDDVSGLFDDDGTLGGTFVSGININEDIDLDAIPDILQ